MNTFRSTTFFALAGLIASTAGCATRRHNAQALEEASPVEPTCFDYATENPLQENEQFFDERLERWIAARESSAEAKETQFEGLSFGLEVELSIQANPRLLCDYRPPNVFADAWQSLSWKAKVRKANEWLPFAKRERKGSDVFLKVDGRAAPRKALTAEPTGMLELRGFVFDDIVDLAKTLRGIERSYGAGQIQAHVVFERRPLPGLVGYMVYESDRALITTLADEYSALTNEKRMPAGHFISSYLKPLNHEMVTRLNEIEDSGSSKGQFSKPHKFLAAPTLRESKTYGQGNLIGFELRQWDFPSVGVAPLSQRSGHLIESVERLASAMAQPTGLEQFQVFTKTHIDAPTLRERAIKQFAVGLSEAELIAFEKRIDDAIMANRYSDKAVIRVVDPGTRFLFPFRNWESYPKIAGMTKGLTQTGKTQLLEATRTYAATYADLASQSDIEGEELLGSLRRALSKWSADSNLEAIFWSEF